MADDYIYDVKHLAYDCDGSLVCRCPHCQRIIGLDASDSDDALGEQFQCRCGGWLQVHDEAQNLGQNPLPANRGVPG